MELFHNGKRKKFFDIWADSLPQSLRDNDQVAQKLEFYLNIYFATYPLKFGKGQVSIMRESADFEFQFFARQENTCISLSQTSPCFYVSAVKVI